MTTVANIVGCSICGGLPPLCPTCEKLDRVLEMRPSEPLSADWGRAQDCPPDAKRVLMALLTKTDFATGFTQLSVRHVARAVFDPTGDGGRIQVQEGDEGQDHYLHAPVELTEPMLSWTLGQMRELVAAGLLESEPPLPPDVPLVLRWLSRRTGTPEGILWLRLKRRDDPPAWDMSR